MLRPDVAEAVDQGRFHVWSMTSVDDALELLTGMEAGLPDDQGGWTADSFNARVDQQLATFAAAAREVRRGGDPPHDPGPEPIPAPPGPPPGPGDRP